MQKTKSYVKVMEVAGFAPAIEAMRYPVDSDTRSDSHFEAGQDFIMGWRDAQTARSLVLRGDDHAKFTRGIVAWLKIKMPRMMWQEIDTYTVGVLPMSSRSTIHTLKKNLDACADDIPLDEYIANELCEEGTSVEAATPVAMSYLKHTVAGSAWKELLPVVKCNLPEGFMQERVRAFSYQTLRRIYIQRKGHIMPQWRVFVDAIRSLPYFDILICPEEAEGSARY